MSLSELSRLSLENISRLASQKSGIPRISHSNSRLSDQEHEYLRLFKELNSVLLQLEQLPPSSDPQAPSQTQSGDRSEHQVALYQELLHKKALQDQFLESVITEIPVLDAVKNGDLQGQTGPNPILPLLAERDDQSLKLLQQTSRIAALHEKLFDLYGKNRALHTENQQLVAQIDETVRQLDSQPMSNAQDYQLQQIDQYKAQLQRCKSDIVLLSEFLVALITATGVDWALSPSLQKLILECGDYAQLADNESDVWMT